MLISNPQAQQKLLFLPPPCLPHSAFLASGEVLEGAVALEVAVGVHVKVHRLVVGREADDLLTVEVDVASGADRVNAAA
jgi:hypothetical protein